MSTTERKEGKKVRAGDYVWLEEESIGEGTFGTVIKGRNVKTGAFVAVKTCKSVSQLQQHLQEIKLLSKLDSPFIVKLITTEKVEGSEAPAMIMERADDSLRSELKKPENNFGLPYTMLITVISHIEGGLSYLNEQKIVHRDIKPENVLVFRGLSETFFKLCDFGCSRTVEESDQSLYSVVGTPGYLDQNIGTSAARIERAKQADVLLRGVQRKKYTKDECDLWSFGCLVFECATGRLPFVPAKGVCDFIGMHNMLEMRPADAICGYERDGKYTWETELPKNLCLYPKSLQRILCEFLRRIFDRRSSSRLTFKEFSDMCAELTSLRTFRLLNIKRLTVEDFFDTSDSVCFKRVPFKEEVLRDLPQARFAYLLSLPSRSAVDLIHQSDNTAIEKPSDVALVASKQEDGASWAMSIVDPALPPHAPSVDQLERLDEKLLSRSLKRPVAWLIRFEKKTEALWTFIEGCQKFCSTFAEMLGGAVDSLTAEISSSRQIADAIRLQSAALGTRRPANEKIDIEHSAQQIAAKMNENERDANELRERMAKVKEAVEKFVAREVPKFISQKPVLEEVIKRLDEQQKKLESQSSGQQQSEDSTDDFLTADRNLVISSLKSADKKHEQNLAIVHDIVNNSATAILKDLFNISKKFEKVKAQLYETMELVNKSKQTNQHRIEILQQNETEEYKAGDNGTERMRALLDKVAAALKKAEEEARICHEEAIQSQKRRM